MIHSAAELDGQTDIRLGNVTPFISPTVVTRDINIIVSAISYVFNYHNESLSLNVHQFINTALSRSSFAVGCFYYYEHKYLYSCICQDGKLCRNRRCIDLTWTREKEPYTGSTTTKKNKKRKLAYIISNLYIIERTFLVLSHKWSCPP